jgi:hypothetical protein
MAQPKWTIERRSPESFVIEWSKAEPGQFHTFLGSDLHADNQNSDLKLIHKDLAEAVRRDAPIILAGDTFCAMQGKWDPRKSDKELRAELRNGDYFDALVKYVFDICEPYKSHIAIIGQGNHETSVIKRHETNLVQRLVDKLRDSKGGSPAMAGEYRGWAIHRWQLRNRASKASRTVYFHHGYGGGGEVTRGMIDNSRTRSMIDADIFFSGHIHRRNCDDDVFTYCERNGLIVERRRLFLRGGAYKNDQHSQWQIERGSSARPKGGWFVRFDVKRDTRDDNIDVHMAAEMA